MSTKFINFIIKYSIYFYVKLLFLTYRLEIENNSNYKIGVFYFWHRNIIAASFFFFKKNLIGYCISNSTTKGKIIGFIAQKLGFKVIYKSADEKPLELIRRSLDILDVNKRIGITGDGPYGPANKLQRGVIYLAAKSNLPLIFIDFKTEYSLTLKKSWDKFQIPLPFSKISVKMHTPIIPSKDAYKEF